MHNNRNALLKDAARIACVRDGQFLVVIDHDEVGGSALCGKRPFFYGALHPDTAVCFATFSYSNFIDVAVVVDSRGKESADDDTATNHNEHQDRYITPLRIALARR